jgi:hypothetical protein
MDFGNLTDGIILLVSGAIVALYGAGKLIPKSTESGTSPKDKKKIIFMIGLVILFAGIVQLARHIIT